MVLNLNPGAEAEGSLDALVAALLAFSVLATGAVVGRDL